MTKTVKKTARKTPKAKISIKPIKPFRLDKAIYYELGYSEFEDMVKEVYKGKPGADDYSFVAEEESANDVSHTFTAEKRRLDKDERPFEDEDSYNSTDVILDDMCNRGFIPAGKYIISVCW